jgi:hypothetical protein
MRARGVSDEECKAEIGRAFLGCLCEQWRGMPDRLASVFGAMEKGRTAVELFPDELYEESSNRAERRARKSTERKRL